MRAPLAAISLALAFAGAGTAVAAQNPAPLAAAPAPAKPDLPVLTPTAESRALSLELAALLNSEAITRKQLDKAYTETLPKVMKSSPVFAELEKKFPGIADVAIKAERDIVEPWSIAQLPEIHKVIADKISAYLTASDIKALLAFYKGPVGAKVLDGVAEGSDITQIAQRNLEGGDVKLTAGDIDRATARAAAPTIMRKLDAADLTALMKFTASPEGLKWREAQKAILPAVAEYQQRASGSTKTEAEQHVLVAVQAFMEKSGATAPVQKN